MNPPPPPSPAAAPDSPSLDGPAPPAPMPTPPASTLRWIFRALLLVFTAWMAALLWMWYATVPPNREQEGPQRIHIVIPSAPKEATTRP
jgi:hypothetical protein